LLTSDQIKEVMPKLLRWIAGSRLKGFELLDGKQYGADLVAVKGRVAHYLLRGLVLLDYTEKFYEADDFYIPEDELPPVSKLPGTVFIFNTALQYGYSFGLKECRDHGFIDTPKSKVWVIPKAHVGKFYDVAGFLKLQCPELTLPS
jgi:hypothetical protein